jgi:hypothetical protein
MVVELEGVWMETHDQAGRLYCPPAHRGAGPASYPAEQNAGNSVYQRLWRRGASEGEHLPFESGEGRETAEKTGHQQWPQIRMEQIFLVEQHQQQPYEERACNINQKRRKRKTPVVMFIHSESREIPRQRPNGASGQDEKASNQQSTDFSAATGFSAERWG